MLPSAAVRRDTARAVGQDGDFLPDRARAITVYPVCMNELPTGSTESSRSIGRMIVAGLILAVAAWLLFKFVLGIVAFFAGILAVVVAIVAVIWALRVLF